MKRTPLRRKTPLRAKKPNTLKPMKAKADSAPRIKRPNTRKKAATAEEKRHMGRLAEMGCIICRQPAEIHHVTSDRFKRITRTNKRTVPLCPRHHRLGPDAVEAISHQGFYERFGIDLLEWADNAWTESNS